MGLPLRTNFVWTLSGNVVYAACQWATLSSVAKFGNPSMVGQFALGLSVTAPVIMLTNLQLRGVQATDTQEHYSFGDYLGLRLTTSLLSLAIFVVVVQVAGYSEQSASVVYAVGLSKVVEAIADVFYGLFQRYERLDHIARSMMMKGPAALIAMVGGTVLTGQVLWGTLGLALAWTLFLVFYDIPTAVKLIKAEAPRTGWRRVGPKWRTSVLAQLTWAALPLGLVMGLISLNTNIPRYILESHLGEYGLGVFSAIAYLVVAGTTVVSALGQSASPRLARYYADGAHGAFSKLLGKLVVLGAVLGTGGVVVAWLAGGPVLSLLYSAEYAAYSDLFVLTMVAGGVGYVASFLGYGMTAARRFKEQLPLFLFVAAATLLASLVLIPSRGVMGAALAMVVGSTTQLAGSWVVIHRALRERRSLTREG